MRPRTISLLVTLGVFLGGLGLVWALSSQRKGGGAGASGDRTFMFPLNSTSRQVSVRSPWQRGHMTPQDDQVELTLVGKCATAHLYAYLSTGWSHGPLNAATVILGEPLRPNVAEVIRHDSNSALVVSHAKRRGVLVMRASSRDYDTLLVDWQGKTGCTSAERGRASVELGRLFDTFRVPAGTG